MSRPHLPIMGQDPLDEPATADGPVLWQSAFRPFFLLAAVAGLLLVPTWIALLRGSLALRPALAPLVWHGHEMIFGFSLAVIAGFLVTAAKVWTGRDTIGGRALIALAALWLACRVLILAGPALAWPAALVNVAFPLALAASVAPALIRSRSVRNYPFLFLLTAMAAAEAAIWGEALGLWVGVQTAALWVGLDAVVAMIVVVGGRILPMFTKNATGASVRDKNPLDRAAPAAIFGLLIADGVGLEPRIVAALFLVAGALTLGRMVGWATPAAMKRPFIGVLHVGYALTAAGLLIEGASAFIPDALPNLGRHITTVGGVSVICMGMMTRVALGHTGRPLHPPRGTVGLYTALIASAALRSGALVWPEATAALLWTSAVLFAAAFAGYLALYGRVLWLPRVDGKPG